jgi:hypothetical protein
MSVKCVELFWVSWKFAQLTTYFTFGRRWIYVNTLRIYCPVESKCNQNYCNQTCLWFWGSFGPIWERGLPFKFLCAGCKEWIFSEEAMSNVDISEENAASLFRVGLDALWLSLTAVSHIFSSSVPHPFLFPWFLTFLVHNSYWPTLVFSSSVWFLLLNGTL